MPSALHGEYRQFRSQDGRTLEAEPIGVYEDNVILRRKDGNTFTVSPTIFSEPDQRYLKTWMLRYLGQNDALLQIRATRKEVAPDEQRNDDRYNTFQYELRLKNISHLPIERLSLRIYNVVTWEKDGKKKQGISDGMRPFNRSDLDIPAGESVTIDSPQQRLLTDRPTGNRNMPSFATVSELDGVLVRVYDLNTLILEWSDPSYLVEQFPADPPKKEKAPNLNMHLNVAR